MPANYVLLEKITVGAAGASSVTFSGIPQTGYTDLQLAFSPHTDRGGYANADMSLEINGSTSITSKAIYSSSSGISTAGLQALFQGGNDGLAANQSLVFGPTTIYFSNYTSSNYKSYSVEFTAEGATADMDQARNGFAAGLWSSTSAINSIKISPNSGTSFTQYSTFYLYGVAAYGTTPVIVPYATGGDTIMTDGSYWYHAFLSSGTFTPRKSITADYAVIAGGAAGSIAGGAGAGGFRLASSQSLTETAYTATIGSGGSGLTNGNNGTSVKGNNSSFIGGAVSTTATGGGGGGAVNTQPGATGGSGGGGGSAAGGAGNQGGYSPVEGYNGGAGGSYASPYMGGGGGGAGGVGGNSVGSVGGAGGIGTNAISTWLSALSSSMTGPWATATATGYIASGGAGGSYDGGGTSGAVSLGGGKAYVGGGGTAGTPNTGGGGGSTTGGSVAGNGGSGIIIVRYAV